MSNWSERLVFLAVVLGIVVQGRDLASGSRSWVTFAFLAAWIAIGSVIVVREVRRRQP